MATAVDEMETFEDFASDQEFSDFDDEGEETMEEVDTDHMLDLLSETPSARLPASLSVVTNHGFSGVATAQQAAREPCSDILEIPDDDPFVDFFQLVKASPQTPSSLQQTKHTTAPSMDEKSVDISVVLELLNYASGEQYSTTECSKTSSIGRCDLRSVLKSGSSSQRKQKRQDVESH
ncbi:hypothetical protein Poli38472_007428 [Pythium oligandrum]|uniref:Uncharacterized protein n=1 Tax=Pythium oligandrum TaxID=41045 RepID=A0A8K1FM18_PYTOL|nr:hypothetical protein Poli38472_007428 [Pythium oligandrum]|eukprot:TMW67756.1 hypothetical protein Poli38472_007428 [Pythium oligandrum]